MKSLFNNPSNLLFSFCLFILLTSCGTQSNLMIDPYQSFVLGEYEKEAFKVDAENTSNKNIELVIVDKQSQDTISKQNLSPKSKGKINATNKQKLLIKNNNNKRVKIKVQLNKGVEGMRYEPITQSDNNLLKKDSLIADLQLLKTALKEMHPGLYRYNTPQQIENYFVELENDLPNQISEGDFLIVLAQLTAKIKCGHTYLNPWNMNKALRDRLFGGNTFIPIGFKIIDGRFYATENASNNSDIKRGAEMLEINNIPTAQIYKELQTIAKMDGNNETPIDHYLSVWNYLESNWHAFDLYFQLFHPLKGDAFDIKFANYGEQQSQTINVKALSKSERAQKMATKYGDKILDKKEWSLDILSKDLAVIRLGTFAIWNFKDFDHVKWYEQQFRTIDSLGIKRLAIDIRGNGGGLSEPANELISYLINDTLRCDDLGKIYIRTTKFSEALMPHIDTWVDALKTGLPQEVYTPAENGLYELLLPSDCQDVAPKPNRFEGQVYIFGGPSNVSATYTLLDKANRFGFAEYLGEESGGNLQGINGGEYAFFTLPYSKAEVDIPLKYFSSKTERRDGGVKPQKEIKYTQEDIALEKDPFIDYISK